jgi:lipoprotein-anchoring transpeptidase ErfK/SrfK
LFTSGFGYVHGQTDFFNSLLEQPGNRRLFCPRWKSIRGIMSRFGFAIVSLAATFLVVSEVPAARSEALFSTPFGIVYTIHSRDTVPYGKSHPPGTIVVATRERHLYYILGDGQALRYTIGVGKEGSAWTGVSTISAKREWPDWSPTPNIRKQHPDLPMLVKGGESNPLGARALYLGASLYRIHGTNEPWRIGDAASAGCIRMSNDDVIDLYNRAKIGATVVVLP